MPFFDARFDVSSVKELERKLARLPRPAANAVRKSNRKWAAKLRDLIRAKAPSGGGAKHGSRHDTKPGALRRAIRSRASANSAKVMGGYGGGDSAAPHFGVNEWGGGVRWVSKNGKAHGIFIKPENPSGYFFRPTVREHAPQVGKDAAQDAIRVVKETLGS